MRIVLTVTSGPHAGREFEFDRHENFIVGRSKSAQFRLPQKDQYFSRNHFLVEVNPPLCRLLDLNSTNGTYVNGQAVSSQELHDGDMIEAGDTKIRVKLIDVPSSLVSDGAPHQSPSQPEFVGEQTIKPRNWPPQALNSSSPHEDGPSHDNAMDATLVPSPPRPLKPITPTGVSEPAVANLMPSAEEQALINRQPQPYPNYQIIEELGRGGMGVVYRGRAVADGSPVAIKVILPAVAGSPDDLARFVREADILKNLNHPNIVPFRDLGHAAGQLYFVMNLIPGIDAQELAKKSGPLSVKQSVGIIVQLLDALAAAHRAGYVHRDVKPSNLLIESQGKTDRVWLADFGLARAYHSSKLSGLTTTGNIGGTLPYMAPEQITHFRDVGPAADQYSAAATLYFLLTLRFPYDFPRETARQLLMVLQESPQPVRDRRPDLPQPLADVIARAMSRNIEDRFRDVIAMKTALKPWA